MITEIQIADIVLEERQRKDYGDLTELIKSINRYGQFQNLLVQPKDGKFRLIAGGRRLAGLIGAKKDTAFVKLYEGPADELLLQELELEENIQRKDLTWQEKNAAIDRIHNIKVEQAKREGKDWTIDETAKLIEMSKRSIYNAIELTKAVQSDPEVAKADTAFGAMQRVERNKQMKNRIEAVKVRELAENLGMAKKNKIIVHHGDALAGMKSYADSSKDFIFTNPPYGVNIEDVFTSDKKIYGNDDPEIMAALCAAVFKEAFRVLKDDRWFVTFYPTLRLEECRSFLADAGFKFQKVPAIWVKPNKYMSSVNDPHQQLGIRYETFFFARKGNAKFRELPKEGNVFSFDTPASDRIHPLQMPPELWDEVMRLCTIRGEQVVEPFSGSGSGGVAAIGRDLDYDGWEIDQEYVARSNTWISETQAGGKDVAAVIDNDPEVQF